MVGPVRSVTVRTVCTVQVRSQNLAVRSQRNVTGSTNLDPNFVGQKLGKKHRFRREKKSVFGNGLSVKGGGGVPPFSVKKFPLTFRENLVRGGPGGGGGYPFNGKFPWLGLLNPSLRPHSKYMCICVLFESPFYSKLGPHLDKLRSPSHVATMWMM